MRLGIAILVLAAGATVAVADEPPTASQKELRARYEKLVASDWFVEGGWTEDYDAALARARETGRTVLAYFTRSYAP